MEERIIPVYQRLINNVDSSSLPASWDFKFDKFSKSKKLYDYQKYALNAGLKFLHHYYSEILNYPESDYNSSILEGKKSLFNEIQTERIVKRTDILDISVKDTTIFKIASQFYNVEGKSIPFFNFTNRMGFWMATGSGKSLVIVKLIEILYKLKKRGSIPDEDILFLTYRDDLIDQIKAHIDEFNLFSPVKIKYWDLKDYDKVKHDLLFSRDDINIFIYRSDLISDTSAEKLLSFEDIENNGKWYIILDEAHKGTNGDSKRQIFYSILSRNGFLFNFSATFTDPWDIITTVYNLNLDRFTEKGYGKNIYVSQQDLSALERYNKDSDSIERREEKKKIVLKTLITLAIVKKAYKQLSTVSDNIYHNPLLLLYGHTTEVENADIQIFFETLGDIALNRIDSRIFEECKNSILDEFKNQPSYVFGKDTYSNKLRFNYDNFSNLTFDDVLKLVYNSDSTGKIEVVRTKANKEELAFKLKTSDKYFASIKIGDITKWLNDKLVGYEVSENPTENSFFANIDNNSSPINILMGSRAYYEGWDLNRPNVMVFVNIGKGDAKKYILQSIGRGVRIEPFKNKRQRLAELSRNGDLEAKKIFSILLEKNYEGLISIIETLFIFGTDEDNITAIMDSIKFEMEKNGEILDIRKTKFDFNPKLLLPVFLEKKEVELKELPTFRGNFELLEYYVNWMEDDRVIYANYSTVATPTTIGRLHNYLKPDNISRPDDISKTNSVDAYNQLYNLIEHLNTSRKYMDKFKDLEDEIIHFKEISVEGISEEKKKELNEIIQGVRNLKNPEFVKKDLQKRYESGEIGLKEFTDLIEKLGKTEKTEKPTLFDFDKSSIRLINIAQHYYLPIILSESDKADILSHVIKVKSEINFIDNLDKFVSGEELRNYKLDWWVFSKIDESIDKVNIPYYDGERNRMREYSPDFIFWLKKGSEYRIVFVDPKSTKYTDYEQKADYFSRLFEENGFPKEFQYGGFSIKVHLFMVTDNINSVGENYKKYWMDNNIDKIFSVFLG
ncbi:DEAD/DEAH box helicase family protein [Ferroplasma acidiphilum]|uniref:DEAD/DEAH box helicase family protein n=1 Tax=Ferroplasma acidiphilum TaxID=74969 RepID=UPI0028152E03|nr:DEAD/DEAH box helicase family protein [Ferroplasma acidiphilum]WMT52307.1 MAG: DEAD/DEAH box helicase family protein [Ferroplasma acidiphilum]